MPKDDLQEFFEALKAALVEQFADPRATVAILISETIKFRDRLLAETGHMLTVGETSETLEVLLARIENRPITIRLTDIQQQLLDIWLKRLTFTGN
jgi:hypothetical protein